MAAGSHILTSKSAWLRMCIRTQAERSQHAKNGKANMQRQAYTWMHKLTLTQSDVYTQT